MTNQELNEMIYRCKVCEWAYGWTLEEAMYKLRHWVQEKQWHEFWQRKEQEKKCIENLIEELKSRKPFEEEHFIIQEMPKNRSYGNKYIRRSNRWNH